MCSPWGRALLTQGGRPGAQTEDRAGTPAQMKTGRRAQLPFEKYLL